jgi:glycosyltransferase involved in cell wall biosynthesis
MGFSKWLTYISKTIDFEVKIARYGSEKLINELELSSEFKIIGSLSNRDLLDVMSETTAVLIHQRYGLGSLTKIPEMLIAGIPVIANNIAARSYYDYNGIHIYNNIQELAQLMSQTFLVPEVPLPPLQDEKRFIYACMNN